jgi:hypothetical protein
MQPFDKLRDTGVLAESNESHPALKLAFLEHLSRMVRRTCGERHIGE